MTLEKRITALRDAMHLRISPRGENWPPPSGAPCECLVCQTIGQCSEIFSDELMCSAMLQEYELTPETKRN